MRFLIVTLGCAKNEVDSDRMRALLLADGFEETTDAAEAERLGCRYITLGHIFETDCKPGVPPRGLGLLREVCGSTQLPVLAIGGINVSNVGTVRAAGASGVCIMSGLMRCENVGEYLAALRESGEKA